MFPSFIHFYVSLQVNSYKCGKLNISKSEVETLYSPLNRDSLIVANSINKLNINIKLSKIN